MNPISAVTLLKFALLIVCGQAPGAAGVRVLRVLIAMFGACWP